MRVLISLIKHATIIWNNLHFWEATFLRMMIPSWLCSLVVISNMAPPSPGTIVYSTSAFFPMSRSWALILPTAEPTADDSGTLRWKKPANNNNTKICLYKSDRTQAHLLSSVVIKWKCRAPYILCALSILSPSQGCLIHPQAKQLIFSVSEVRPVAIGMILFNFDVFGHQGCSAPWNWLAQPVRPTYTRVQGLWYYQQQTFLPRIWKEIYKQTNSRLIDYHLHQVVDRNSSLFFPF